MKSDTAEGERVEIFLQLNTGQKQGMILNVPHTVALKRGAEK